VTSSKNLWKEIPSANVDGVYILQDLNCLTATNSKVSVNGEVPHAQWYNSFPGTKDESADLIAHGKLRDFATTIGDVAVPTDDKDYSAKGDMTWTARKIDAGDDISFPYSISLTEAWMHTPSLNNLIILSPLNFGQQKSVKEHTRDKGYKFGY